MIKIEDNANLLNLNDKINHLLTVMKNITLEGAFITKMIFIPRFIWDIKVCHN
jgi:hypothetical protein